MKFEKLNENKIRIILNHQDLSEKNIDSHSFMSNSQESQNLFIAVLNEAEQKIGFITKDYKLRIETLALSDGNFILTITRFGNNVNIDSKAQRIKNIKIQRKQINTTSKQLIFKFNCFEDFCNFSKLISKTKYYNVLIKQTTLFSYKNTYYLCLYNINTSNSNLKNLYTLITEFATYTNNSAILLSKLSECGTIIFKNNAVEACINYF